MKRTTPPDRLSRDVMAAQAAGLSYGNYKALHPCTGEDEPEEIVLDDDRRQLTCAYCGKVFVTNSRQANRLYCDDVCKQAAWTARSSARKQGEKQPHCCAICGREIDRAKGRLYCSLACRGEANRIRANERSRRIREMKA